MSQPQPLNELQVERVMDLWFQFHDFVPNQDLIDKFIHWLEVGKPEVCHTCKMPIPACDCPNRSLDGE